MLNTAITAYETFIFIIRLLSNFSDNALKLRIGSFLTLQAG